MENKKCTKCGKVLPIICFYRDNRRKDKCVSSCKECHKAYQRDNKERYKAYYQENKEALKISGKEYRKGHKEEKKVNSKIYRDAHKAEEKIQNKKTYKKHKKRILKRRVAPAKYNRYSKKLGFAEKTQEDENGYLVCLCTYCGKKFVPRNAQVGHRIASLNGGNEGEARLYCSEKCKKACPTFWRRSTQKLKKKGTSREVPAEFRQMALKDRNYTCEKCGSTENGLHVHHIDGATEQPLFSADLKNIIVVCKSCHKKIHKKTGCGYHDYRCNAA